VAGCLFVAPDSRASSSSGPMLGSIAKPRSMCRTEHPIRLDGLSVSIKTRRLFAYSSYLLHGIDPAESFGATDINRNRVAAPVSYLQTRKRVAGLVLSMSKQRLTVD
jgi:hypothetical protein